ncbi:hypothetical protein NEOLEDRAFT_1132856 [Neolentinus lepideus HHB14362 ss-1]|uniref:Uncharacterized protein n=1 Tax=Neolentinus lepideus HHB14362 ss-1 TaxID=1314782 RepID=A0A165SYL4_9AGAM|nr:hypothetical protein NEOLEDRAFT_1132856 [Neolentinus lepideus HHB14362 ss-1]
MLPPLLSLSLFCEDFTPRLFREVSLDCFGDDCILTRPVNGDMWHGQNGFDDLHQWLLAHKHLPLHSPIRKKSKVLLILSAMSLSEGLSQATWSSVDEWSEYVMGIQSKKLGTLDCRRYLLLSLGLTSSTEFHTRCGARRPLSCDFWSCHPGKGTVKVFGSRFMVDARACFSGLHLKQFLVTVPLLQCHLIDYPSCHLFQGFRSSLTRDASDLE